MPTCSDDFKVEIGALGPAFGHPHTPVFEGEQFVDQGRGLSYEQRKRVSLTITGKTSFGEIIDKAAEQFGVRIAPAEIPISRRVPVIALANTNDGSYTSFDFIHTLEPDGSRGWPLYWQDITIEELVASVEAGLLGSVDPTRSLFWPVIPQAVFTDVGGVLLWLWTMWGQALAARDTVALANAALSRLTRGRDSAEAQGTAWHETFRRMNDLMVFLDCEARTTREMQGKTGFSERDAEGTLLALGYTRGADERWRLDGDQAAVIVRTALEDRGWRA